MTTIAPLPISPSRLRKATFLSEADAWDAALAVFSVETAAYAANLASAYDTANTSLAAALWVSGTTYAIGDRRYSPANGLLYRRKTAGAGTTDPSADTTNWDLMATQAPPLVTHSGTSATMTLNAHNECTNAGIVTATFPLSPIAGAWFWLGFQNERADNVLDRNAQLIMKQANNLTTGRRYHSGLWRFVSAGFGWRLMLW